MLDYFREMEDNKSIELYAKYLSGRHATHYMSDAELVNYYKESFGTLDKERQFQQRQKNSCLEQIQREWEIAQEKKKILSIVQTKNGINITDLERLTNINKDKLRDLIIDLILESAIYRSDDKFIAY